MRQFDDGSKVLAILAISVLLLFIMGGTVMSIAFWLFKRGVPMLVFVVGCQECRMAATCRTLFQEVTVNVEVVR
jgi:hypothetical protein